MSAYWHRMMKNSGQTAASRWQSRASGSLTFSQSKLQDYKHWTSALCAVSVYLSVFAQCQIILLDDTDSGVQESAQRERKSNTHSLHHVTSPVCVSTCPLRNSGKYGQGICTKTVKLQSNRHHNKPPPNFYRPDVLPVAQPTLSKH